MTRPRAGVANITLETYNSEDVLTLNLFETADCHPAFSIGYQQAWSDDSIPRTFIQLTFRSAADYCA
jgi:hypothetical protein